MPVRMSYTVSCAGRQRAAEMSSVQTRYLGPCPINFDDYLSLIRSQVTGKANVTDAALKRALGQLELEQHVIDQIGGAMVSRASLFIFGAPGNGKSTITERMALLMGAAIEIPHAVAIGDEIIRVIDPVYHKISEGEQPVDRRLVKVERPVVVAGGELKLEQLDLTYDTANRYYEKPLRGSHPRSLVARLVDLANYRQESPRLTPQTLKEAFDACFNPALGSVTEDDWARPQTN